MARKKRSKAKISLEVVLAILLIAIIAAVICYFAVPSFKKMVDDYLQRLVQGNDPGTNDAKGESELRVHYLDVGQGDSILIEFPDDTDMLIDSGDRRNATAEYIETYLKNLGIETLDYLMLTHSDSDHVGNMVQVLEAFEVEKAYIPSIDEGVITTDVYNNFYKALKNEKYTTENGSIAECEIVISQMGELIKSENATDKFFMAFLSPSPRGMLEDGEYDVLNSKKPNTNGPDKNAVSPITYLEYMGKKIIFTGDVTGDPAERVMKNYETGVYNNMFPDGNGGYYAVNFENGVDVYKAAHHGSATHGSNSADFINFLNPKYAVISLDSETAANRDWEMPASTLMESFSDIGTSVYRTDLNGTIVVTVYPDAAKGVSLYLGKQDEEVGSVSDGVAQAAACFVAESKIKVNYFYAEPVCLTN